MIFENEKIYKILKKIWEYGIPALEFLWAGLIEVWNIPYGAQILATIGIVWGALGIFLGVSKYKYNKLNSVLDGAIEDFAKVGDAPVAEEEVKEENDEEAKG